MRLFEEVRAAGYPGGHGQVKRYVGSAAGAGGTGSAVRDRAGRQAQVDFAEFRLPWGKRYVLVVVLGYSRYLWLQCYERPTMGVVVRVLDAAFAHLSGTPAEILFDQMKAVIIEDGRVDGGKWSRTRSFCASPSTGAFASGCRPYRAQTKGKVERQVIDVRNSFFYGRDFASDADLNSRALRWLDTVANVRVHGTLRERPADRLEAERPHLKPLAPWPYRPVTPRLPVLATQRSDEARLPPLVEVERRPLTEYARYSGGPS